MARDHRDVACTALDEGERAARASASESVRSDSLGTFGAERRRTQEAGTRRGEIRHIGDRIGVPLGVSAAVWPATIDALVIAKRLRGAGAAGAVADAAP